MADNNGWHIADRGQSIGPMTLDELVARLPQHGGPLALVYGPGLGAWTQAQQVEAIRARLTTAPPPPPVAPAPPMPPGAGGYVPGGYSTAPAAAPASAFGGGGYGAGAGARPRADVIDYKIHGEEMQFVEMQLDPGETVVAEAGGMMYMTAGVQLQTVFGDPSAQSGGFLGKV